MKSESRQDSIQPVTESGKIDCLLLTGMPRSGISVIAGCLNIMGINMGEQFKNQNSLNDVILIHDILLRDLGCSWDMIGNLPTSWMNSVAASKAGDKIKAFIEDRKKIGRIWGVQDPRLCRLMPFWDRILEEMGIQPGIILSFRHPWEAANSLRQEEGLDLEKGYLLWLSLNREALINCSERQCAIIRFDSFISDPVSNLMSVAEQLNVAYPNSIRKYYQNIINFVRPELKHYHINTQIKNDENKRFEPFFWLYDHIKSSFVTENLASNDNIENRSNINSINNTLAPILMDSFNRSDTESEKYSIYNEKPSQKVNLIYGNILSLIGDYERRERDFRIKKEHQILMNERSEEIMLMQLSFPSPFEKDDPDLITPKFILPKDEWQSLNITIPYPELLQEQPVIFSLNNIRGTLFVSSVKLVNIATEQTIWSATTPAELEALEVQKALELTDEDSLVILIHSADSRLILPAIPDLPDCPMEISIWIRASTDPEYFEAVWNKQKEAKRDIEHEIDELRREFESIKRSRDTAVEDKLRNDKELCLLKKEIEAKKVMERDLAKYSMDLECSRKRVAGLENELGEMRLKNQKMESDAILSKVEIEEKHQRIADFEYDLKESQEKIKMLESRIYDAEAEIISKRERIADLENELKESRAEGQALKKNANLVETELKNKKVKNDQIERALSNSKTRLSRLENRLKIDKSAFERQITTLKLERNDLNNQIKFLSLKRDIFKCFKRLFLSPKLYLIRYLKAKRLSRILGDSVDLLDSEWYLKTYPDVAEDGYNPLLHYFKHGVHEGRNPNSIFETNWYLNTYPDVKKEGFNPLLHYIQFGAKEGRDPSPHFDTDWYLEKNHDVAEHGINPLLHYLKYGFREGRDPSSIFDTKWYLSNYPEVGSSGINPLAHYARYGCKGDYSPNPMWRQDPLDEINDDIFEISEEDLNIETVKEENGNSLNVLFILYESLDSNSGIQIQLHADRLEKVGIESIFAVPTTQIMRGFTAPDPRVRTYEQIEREGVVYSNGKEPDIIHAWTPRETVRYFCEKVLKRYPCPLIIHFEDNEEYLTEINVCKPFIELEKLSDEELDKIIPSHLYHPKRGRKFLTEAQGLTMIIDTLQHFNEANLPAIILPPPVDERFFYPRPINMNLRKELGIREDQIVLAYTGNVHAVNQKEVKELYYAVHLLNKQGYPTALIRSGVNTVSLGREDWIRENEIDMGWVQRDKIPDILAAADYLVQPGTPSLFNDQRIPSKLSEFFAMGRPVILAKTNLGLKVQHKKNGYVVDIADSKSICRAIVDLRKNKELSKEISENSVDFYLQHIAPAFVNSKINEFYKKIIDQSSEDCELRWFPKNLKRIDQNETNKSNPFLKLLDIPNNYFPILEAMKNIQGNLEPDLILVPNVEKAFGEKKLPESNPWVGFLSSIPSKLPDWLTKIPPYDIVSNSSFFSSDIWNRAKKTCRGLFVQTEEHAHRIKSLTNVQVKVLRIPLPIVDDKWSWSEYVENPEKKIIQVGWWMQRVHAIHLLPVQGIRKIWIKGADPIIDEVITAERQHLMNRHILFDFMLESVELLEDLQIEEYLELFRKNVLFLHYYDANCLDIVRTCIAGHIPLLINPHAAVREILGNDYPFYYYFYKDASEKAISMELVCKTHDYIRKLSVNYK